MNTDKMSLGTPLHIKCYEFVFLVNDKLRLLLQYVDHVTIQMVFT